MELQTVQQVTKKYQISARMLRYYEKIGLLQSSRKEDYAYRVYDEIAQRRIGQIIILRKLRVSMKHIGVILSEPAATEAIEIFKQNIGELDGEIRALSVIRDILAKLAAELQEKAHVRLEIDALMESPVLSVVQSLSLSKNLLRENLDMNDLHQASEQLGKLTDRDVRILYLPPSSVAAIHIVGEQPETDTGDVLFSFIKDKNISSVFPEFRHYGFNHDSGGKHGYERWVTIPSDMAVPSPFAKKHFSGGLYAAFMIPMGMFDEWNRLHEWAANHEKYEIAWGDPECMHGFLEEHLNAWNHYTWSHEKSDRDMQLDLLLPIKERTE